MRRVLAFVEDPGAAHAMVGLGAALAAGGAQLRLFATGHGRTLLDAGGVAYEPLTTGATADAMLTSLAPEAVLVGTSENPDSFAFELVAAAARQGVSSFGFVDALANAAHRFRGRSDDALRHAPRTLLVPDAATEAAFVALGLTPAAVHVVGNPSHDRARARAAALAARGRDALRAQHAPGCGERPVVVFCSEISTGLDGAQFVRNGDYTLAGRGEREGRTAIVLEELFDACTDLAGTGASRPYVVVRLHPKNTREELGALLDEADAVSAGGDPLEVVYAADLVCGMTTNLLDEAAALGGATLSVVPRYVETAWLASARDGTTVSVTTRQALREAIARLAVRRPSRAAAPAPPPRTATQRIADRLLLHLSSRP